MPRPSRCVAVFAASFFAGAAAGAESAPEWQNGLVMPNGDAGMLYMGQLGGFGAAFGLDLKTVPLKGDPLLLKALLAGQLDSYIGGPGSPLVAASKGADIRIVGCGWVKQNYVLFGKPSVRSLDDLRGKTVGISSPGSAPDIFIHAALNGANVPVDSVQFIAAGMPPELLKQTAEGRIDATATPGEYAARATAMGLTTVATSAQATPLAMQRCYFVRGATLREQPDRVARFLAAEMVAYDYSLKHRDETIALTRSILSAPPAAVEPVAGYDQAADNNVIDVSFEPPMEKLRWLRDALAQNGQLKAAWDPASMIDLGPLKRAREMAALSGADAAKGASAALSAAGAAVR